MNALLVEAERVVDGNGNHFHRNPKYLELAAAVRTPKFREVVTRSRPVRHWAVFHFFSKAVEEVVGRGYFSDPPEFVTFLSGHGKKDFDIQCDLAEEVPFQLILGQVDPERIEETLRAWLGEASTAATDLIRALDVFLASMATELGAFERQVPSADTGGSGRDA